MSTEYTTTLRRAGLLLLIVGGLDMALMLYCIVNRINYSSSLNLFAVVAGIFLLRKSLRAAAIVRWFAILILTTSMALLLTLPLLQPLDLTLTQLRLHPQSLLSSLATLLLLLALLGWLVRTLGNPSVKQAQAQTGIKSWNTRLALAIGMGFPLLLMLALTLFLGGDTASRAKAMAAQQVGSDSQLHVSALNISGDGKSTSVAAMVIAWNKQEIREIPVQWQE